MACSTCAMSDCASLTMASRSFWAESDRHRHWRRARRVRLYQLEHQVRVRCGARDAAVLDDRARRPGRTRWDDRKQIAGAAADHAREGVAAFLRDCVSALVEGPDRRVVPEVLWRRAQRQLDLERARGKGAGLMQCGLGIGFFIASLVWLFVN